MLPGWRQTCRAVAAAAGEYARSGIFPRAGSICSGPAASASRRPSWSFGIPAEAAHAVIAPRWHQPPKRAGRRPNGGCRTSLAASPSPLHGNECIPAGTFCAIARGVRRDILKQITESVNTGYCRLVSPSPNMGNPGKRHPDMTLVTSMRAAPGAASPQHGSGRSSMHAGRRPRRSTT
jgi:hypothetical protein